MYLKDFWGSMCCNAQETFLHEYSPRVKYNFTRSILDQVQACAATCWVTSRLPRINPPLQRMIKWYMITNNHYVDGVKNECWKFPAWDCVIDTITLPRRAHGRGFQEFHCLRQVKQAGHTVQQRIATFQESRFTDWQDFPGDLNDSGVQVTGTCTGLQCNIDYAVLQNNSIVNQSHTSKGPNLAWT